MALRLVATCALGLEEFVELELRGLGVSNPRREKGAVAFAGSWTDAMRSNWRLRTANRVLIELGRYDEALEWLARAGGVDPDRHEVFYFQGMVYERLDDAARARDYYSQALEAKPTYEVAREALERLAG